MSRDHRKLRLFQQADALVLRTYRLTVGLPVEERYGLQAQIRRAAISVATNIVEGSARYSAGDYCRFLEIAHGSARETSYLLGLLSALEFIDAALTQPLANDYDTVAAGLLKLTTRLRHSPP